MCDTGANFLTVLVSEIHSSFHRYFESEKGANWCKIQAILLMGSVMFTLSDVLYCIFIITLQNSVGKIQIFDIIRLAGILS